MDRGLYNLVIFLDLQKAFDTVNHVLLLGKLEACGIRDNALNLLASYLADRKQTCQVNGKQSGLRSISCGIPQGSILGPLFFLVYINDLPNCLKHTTPRMFADDTSLTTYGKSIEEIELGLNEDLEKIRLWLQANKLSLNVAKTEYMLIGSRQRLAKLPLEPNICIGSEPIKRVRDTKIVEVCIDESLTWSKHIDEITKKITAGISALKRLRDFASRDALIMPHFDYCCEVWDSLGSVLAKRLQKLHNRCARLIMRYKNEAGQFELALRHLGRSLLSERRFHIKARQMFKVLHDLAPVRLSNIFRNSFSANSYHLRNADNKLALPLPKTEFLKKSFSYNGARVWNSLPNEIRNCEALPMFDKLISTYRPNVI